jgi:hypothetical protein
VRHPHLHRHAVIVWILILAAVALVATNPRRRAPAATRVLNRLLLAGEGRELKVRAYHVRPGVGVDLYDVSVTLSNANGDLSLIATDTLDSTSRPRGPGPALPRAGSSRMVWRYRTRPSVEGRNRRQPRLPRLRADVLEIADARTRWPATTAAPRRPCPPCRCGGDQRRRTGLDVHDGAGTGDSRRTVPADCTATSWRIRGGVPAASPVATFGRGGPQPGKCSTYRGRARWRARLRPDGHRAGDRRGRLLVAHIWAAADTGASPAIQWSFRGVATSGAEAQAVITSRRCFARPGRVAPG